MICRLVDLNRSWVVSMKGQWKLFLTGSALGALLGGYMVSRMNGNGRHTEITLPEERNRNRLTETVAGLASQVTEKMDDLSLRARTLSQRMSTR